MCYILSCSCVLCFVLSALAFDANELGITTIRGADRYGRSPAYEYTVTTNNNNMTVQTTGDISKDGTTHQQRQHPRVSEQ